MDSPEADGRRRHDTLLAASVVEFDRKGGIYVGFRVLGPRLHLVRAEHACGRIQGR